MKRFIDLIDACELANRLKVVRTQPFLKVFLILMFLARYFLQYPGKLISNTRLSLMRSIQTLPMKSAVKANSIGY